MIVSKTRNAPGWATKADNLIPNVVKCNENVIRVSVLRLHFTLQNWNKFGWFFTAFLYTNGGKENKYCVF